MTRFLPVSALLFLGCLALPAVRAKDEAPKANSAVAGTDRAWWMPRHEAVKKAVAETSPRLLLIGDSITHWWGGVPGEAGKNTGADSYARYFGSRAAVNLGFASDRTYHVLWRLKNGELAGATPKVAVVMIGTNNAPTPGFSPEETARAVKEICDTVRKASPKTKILLLGVFPRDRIKTAAYIGFPAAVNRSLRRFDGVDGITYLDINDKLGNPDGTCRPGLFSDGLHPTAAGYRVWAEALEPTLSRLMGDTPVKPADTR